MAQSLKKWLEERRQASTMTVEVVNLEDLSQWRITARALVRILGGFFEVIGVRVQVPRHGQREVTSWDQPMIQEQGPGAIILIVDEQGRILVHAKAEPGNDAPGCVLLSAPIQCSEANLRTAHGGSKPPFSEFLSGRELHISSQTEDGGRFFKKRNSYGWCIVRTEDLTLTADHRWCTLEELTEALRSGDCNSHLRTALTLYEHRA